jgi:hypothetical protein
MMTANGLVQRGMNCPSGNTSKKINSEPDMYRFAIARGKRQYSELLGYVFCQRLKALVLKGWERKL